MLNFNNCIVYVNGTAVDCESASINSTNKLSPVYSIGNKGVHNIVPDGPITNTLSLNYYINLREEPCFSQLTGIKYLASSQNYVESSGTSVIIGGITGKYCYLQNYSLRVDPNDNLRGTVSFISFNPLVGNLLVLSGDERSRQTYGHGWSTFVASSGNLFTFPTYRLEYNFSADWNPTYIIGNYLPIQVDLIGAREELNITTDKYNRIEFSGDYANNKFLSGNSSGVIFSGIGMLCSNPMTGSGYKGSLAIKDGYGMFITTSGFKISSIDVQAELNNIVTTRTSLTKYY